MRFRYSISLDDFIAAQRTAVHADSRLRWARRVRVILAAVVALLGVILIIQNPEQPGVGVAAIVFVAVWSVFCIFPRRAWKKAYAKTEAFRRELTAEVRDDGIAMSTSVAESVTKWPAFIRYAEGDGIFLLYLQPKIFFMFPKRIFAPGEEEQFREVIRQKITAAT